MLTLSLSFRAPHLSHVVCKPRMGITTWSFQTAAKNSHKQHGQMVQPSPCFCRPRSEIVHPNKLNLVIFGCCACACASCRIDNKPRPLPLQRPQQRGTCWFQPTWCASNRCLCSPSVVLYCGGPLHFQKKQTKKKQLKSASAKFSLF